MSILLFGDFAIPYRGCINVDSIRPITEGRTVIANLEGPFVSRNDVGPFDKSKINLCAETGCLEYLKTLNVKFLSFANNHILDFRQSMQETISVLNRANIQFFGTADKPFTEFSDAGRRICIWGAVSFITGRTSNTYDRINAYNPVRLLRQIRYYKARQPDVYLIVYIHWGYEFAKFPQPADREWALGAIDSGANAVIGVHPHTVQGIERYKHGVIIYSLGNFILPKSALFRPADLHDSPGLKSDLLHLPRIGVEIDTDGNKILIHELSHDKEKGSLDYKGVNHDFEGKGKSFTQLSVKQYQQWYRKQKYKGEQRSRLNIYPTFYSYFYISNLAFHIARFYLMAFRLLRRFLINLHLHTPASYQDLTEPAEREI